MAEKSGKGSISNLSTKVETFLGEIAELENALLHSLKDSGRERTKKIDQDLKADLDVVRKELYGDISKLTVDSNEELLGSFRATLKGDREAGKVALAKQFQELSYKTKTDFDEVIKSSAYKEKTMEGTITEERKRLQ